MPDFDPLSELNPATPVNVARTDAVGRGRPDSVEARRAQMKQLAQEFEAMLMNEMLSGWRNSLLTDEETGGEEAAGLGQMTDMVGSEFGRALSRSGGLGIADVLMRSFERLLGTADSSSPGTEPISAAGVNLQEGLGQPALRRAAAAVTTGNGVTPSAAVRSGSLADVARSAMATFGQGTTPIDGTVTSAYGWRPDPFTGQSRFHAGVDLRMAYGQAVESAAPGRVSFVGEQGGYGLTVVVDHGRGLQTRYAHLSSADVQVGDEVSSGQVVARSGSSGRSTGPHLHVELLSQGKPVDPSGLLKPSSGVADWMAERTPSSRSTD